MTDVRCLTTISALCWLNWCAAVLLGCDSFSVLPTGSSDFLTRILFLDKRRVAEIAGALCYSIYSMIHCTSIEFEKQADCPLWPTLLKEKFMGGKATALLQIAMWKEKGKRQKSTIIC